jgi:hypothetical protein
MDPQLSTALGAVVARVDESLRYGGLSGFAQAPAGSRPDAAPPQGTPGMTPAAPGVAPICVVCEHGGFGGAQWWSANGWLYVGDWWNDRISSIIVVSGRWRFYEHRDYTGAQWDLAPGYYPDLAAVNIPNDSVSSFKPIAW